MEEQIKKEKLYVAILAAIQVSHIIDFVIMMPLGPVLMEEFGINPTEFASLVSSYNFSSATVGLLFSMVADRYDRKKVLLVSMTGFIIGTFFCGFSNGFTQLLMARILTGCFGGVLNSSVMAIATDIVPYERRGKALSVIMSAFSISSVVGIPLGLAISDIWGWHMSFFTIAIFTTIVAILALLNIPKMRDHLAEDNKKNMLKNLFRMVSTKKYIFGHIMIFILAASTFSLIPFLSPFSVKNIGIATNELKYLYLVGGFFTIFTARIFGKLTDNIGAMKIYFLIVCLSVVPILLYTNSSPMSLGVYLVLTTFFMTIISGRMIPAMTLLSAIPEMNDRGSYMGVLNSIRSFGSASSALVAGMIITEAPSGKLVHFNTVGYYSIGLVLLTLPVAYKIHLNNKES